MKLVRENINDYLPAPSKEEIRKRIKNSNADPKDVLTYAARNNIIDIVKENINKIKDPKIKDIWVKTCGGIAIVNGHVELLEYLYEEEGFELNHFDLMQAINNRELEIVKFLVEHGVDITKGSYEAIHTASSLGYTEIENYLRDMLKGNIERTKKYRKKNE